MQSVNAFFADLVRMNYKNRRKPWDCSLYSNLQDLLVSRELRECDPYTRYTQLCVRCRMTNNSHTDIDTRCQFMVTS